MDGGFHADRDKHTTWGTSLVAEDSCGRLAVVLTAGGAVHFEPSSPHFLAEVLPSNSFVGELHAQAASRLILMQCCASVAQCKSTEIVFVFGSTSAPLVSTWGKVSVTQPELVYATQVLDCVVSRIFNATQEHVYSHDMQPLNHYVDCICTHMRGRLSPSFMTAGPLDRSFVRPIDHYLATLCSYVSCSVSAASLGLNADTPMRLLSIDPCVIASRIDGSPVVSGPYDSTVVRILVAIAQYNVCTLASDDHRELLAKSFLLTGCFCATLQETRRRRAGAHFSHGVVTCCSAAENCTYACEVWFNPNCSWRT